MNSNECYLFLYEGIISPYSLLDDDDADKVKDSIGITRCFINNNLKYYSEDYSEDYSEEQYLYALMNQRLHCSLDKGTDLAVEIIREFLDECFKRKIIFNANWARK